MASRRAPNIAANRGPRHYETFESMNEEPVGQHRGNNLDVLRLLFASLVLLSHAPELIDGNRDRELLSQWTGGAMSFGEFAVNGFFALSGFLIMTSWIRRPRLADYLRNRVLRIYPGFIVAYCISVLIVGPLGRDAASYFAQFTVWRFLGSLVTLREPWFAFSFLGQPYEFVNGALWTISYEFTCYLAVAAVGLAAARRLRETWLALTLCLLLAACFLPELHRLPQINRFLPGELVRFGSLFFAGGALALWGFGGVRRPWGIALAAVLFLLSLASVRFATVGFAVFGSVFFLSLGLRGPKLGFTRKWPDISYGVYLYGWPIQKLIHWYWPQVGPVTLFVGSLVLALVCGYLSWTFVESWFMTLRKRSGAIAAAPPGERSVA